MIYRQKPESTLPRQIHKRGTNLRRNKKPIKERRKILQWPRVPSINKRQEHPWHPIVLEQIVEDISVVRDCWSTLDRPLAFIYIDAHQFTYVGLESACFVKGIVVGQTNHHS